MPRARRSAFGMAACDIVAGYERMLSTPPRLTATSGNVTRFRNATAVGPSASSNDRTAPAPLAWRM